MLVFLTAFLKLEFCSLLNKVMLMQSMLMLKTIDMLCHIFVITISPLAKIRGHRGRDRMVVVFTTIYAMSAYHH
jgi:hypothetical protein